MISSGKLKITRIGLRMALTIPRINAATSAPVKPLTWTPLTKYATSSSAAALTISRMIKYIILRASGRRSAVLGVKCGFYLRGQIGRDALDCRNLIHARALNRTNGAKRGQQPLLTHGADAREGI